jgi:hypothetical protein
VKVEQVPILEEVMAGMGPGCVAIPFLGQVPHIPVCTWSKEACRNFRNTLWKANAASAYIVLCGFENTLGSPVDLPPPFVASSNPTENPATLFRGSQHTEASPLLQAEEFKNRGVNPSPT